LQPRSDRGRSSQGSDLSLNLFLNLTLSLSPGLAARCASSPGLTVGGPRGARTSERADFHPPVQGAANTTCHLPCLRDACTKTCFTRKGFLLL